MWQRSCQQNPHRQIWWGRAPFCLFPVEKGNCGSLGTSRAHSSWICLLGLQFCVRPGDFAAAFLLSTKDFFFSFFLLFIFLRWMIFVIVGVQSLVEELSGQQVQRVSTSRQSQWHWDSWKRICSQTYWKFGKRVQKANHSNNGVKRPGKLKISNITGKLSSQNKDVNPCSSLCAWRKLFKDCIEKNRKNPFGWYKIAVCWGGLQPAGLEKSGGSHKIKHTPATARR